jgi:toxin YoeB
MEIILLKQAQLDLEYWKKSGNKAIMKRISELLKDISEHPFSGIGKPEPLKFGLAGKWSRRINHEHRIIYSVDDKGKLYIYVFAMRYHYDK